MRGRIEQQLMLVLSVQVDQPPNRLAKRAGRHERSVDEGAAASLRRDLAAHDRFGPVGPLEDRLDGRGVFAGPHEIGRCPTTDQQPDRANHD